MSRGRRPGATSSGLRRLAGGALAAAVLAAMLGACSSGADMTGSLRDRMRAWNGAAGLSTSEATISDDLSKVDRAWARRDLLSLKTECGLLRGDVANALGVLPTPDPQLTDELGSAYEGLGTAATSCISASGRGSPREIQAALTGLTRAHGAEVRAAARAYTLAGMAGNEG